MLWPLLVAVLGVSIPPQAALRRLDVHGNVLLDGNSTR